MNRAQVRKRIRRVWVILGISATIVFAGWSIVAYRAAPEARDALRSDRLVRVTRTDGIWHFLPESYDLPATAGLIFLPGSLVDPVAYAPLARAVAEAGFPVYLVELPRRGAFGGADDPKLVTRVDEIMRQSDVASRWVVGGHSRGAAVASELADWERGQLAGLILIGTSHPRDVNLARLSIPVTKIIGTRDGLATLAEVEENKSKLPPSTNWVRIEGGNHSQFGWYGFQPGDRRATISASSQRDQMLQAVISTLHESAEVHSAR